jgi:hypothetical protein
MGTAGPGRPPKVLEDAERQSRRSPTGRRRNVTVKHDEHLAIAAMHKRGVPVAAIARMLDRDKKTISRVVSTVKEARGILDAAAADYAALHMRAATIAAATGDARPVEWALERTGAVERSRGAGDSGPRLIVQVGIGLPGLISGASSASPLALTGGSIEVEPAERGETE